MMQQIRKRRDWLVRAWLAALLVYLGVAATWPRQPEARPNLPAYFEAADFVVAREDAEYGNVILEAQDKGERVGIAFVDAACGVCVENPARIMAMLAAMGDMQVIIRTDTLSEALPEPFRSLPNYRLAGNSRFIVNYVPAFVEAGTGPVSLVRLGVPTKAQITFTTLRSRLLSMPR